MCVCVCVCVCVCACVCVQNFIKCLVTAISKTGKKKRKKLMFIMKKEQNKFAVGPSVSCM